jgi:hypothetical protein
MKKEIKTFEKLLKKELYEKFIEAKEGIIDVVMREYDSALTVNDRKSKSNPAFYRDDFEERLENFNYIEESGDTIKFTVPTMENFDFSGRLEVIEQIMEGTVGIYVEVNAEDYEKMFGKKILSRETLDTSVPKKELIYLMRYNPRVRSAELTTFGRRNYLVKYPFSNTPPIKILDEAENFIDENMDKWVKEVVNKVTKKFKKTV